MSGTPDTSHSAQPLAASPGASVRHEMLNEIHALLLGARLLGAQLDAGELDDCRQTCMALQESAQRLKELHQKAT